MRKASVLLTIAVTLLAWTPRASADDISLFIGNMLPNQIEGVTEILPVFGGRYAFDTAAGAVEFGGFNTHAYGVDFTTLEVSLRGEFEVDPTLTAIVYGGPDFNYYKPVHSTERKTETGFHIGGGGMILVSDTLWLRGDMKFMGGPGTSLYFLFSIVFRGARDGAGG